jgi:hypothetical protein
VFCCGAVFYFVFTALEKHTLEKHTHPSARALLHGRFSLNTNTAKPHAPYFDQIYTSLSCFWRC